MGVSFGERLKEERRKAGLNQSDFAKLGGVHRNSQAEYESGKTSPNVDYLLALASGGVDVAYLLTGARSTSEMTAAEGDLIADLRTLPAEPRENIFALVASLARQLSPSNR